MKLTAIFLAAAMFPAGVQALELEGLSAAGLAEIVETAGISVPAPSAAKATNVLPDNAAFLSELPGGTPYEKVRSLFDQGVPATEAGLQGWHSGRWFHRDGRITGALIVGRSVTESRKGGASSSEKRFILSSLSDFNPAAIAHYRRAEFDALSAGKIRAVREMIRDYPRFTRELKFPGAKGASKYDSSETIEYRVAGGLIVERRRDNILDYDTSTALPSSAIPFAAEPCLVDSYAYYFKDVTPQK